MRPGSSDDQTRALQRAIDEAARAAVPLALPPGVYRTGALNLATGTQLTGVRGATKLVFTGGGAMLLGEGAEQISLSGITLDGDNLPLPARHGLIYCLGGRDVRISDCEIFNSGGNGIWIEQVAGDISNNIMTGIAGTAIVSFDAQGPDRLAQHYHRKRTTTALRSCVPRSAMTARWSPITASRTSRPAPAAPDNMATPSMRFALAM